MLTNLLFKKIIYFWIFLGGEEHIEAKTAELSQIYTLRFISL